MIELFPFGRRAMRFELLPLLCAAREAEPRPIVVSSIRDILVGQENLQRADKVCQYLEDYFDHVLVHGDPNFVRLSATFPRTDKIENILTYTGYVVDQSNSVRPEHGAQEVLVSAGGGATGQRLFDIALACRPLTELGDRTWRILVGTRGDIQSLRAQVGKTATNVIVEPAQIDRLAAPGEEEYKMLDLAWGLTLTSRLGCQIVLTEALDGLVVSLPAETHNLLDG